MSSSHVKLPNETLFAANPPNDIFLSLGHIIAFEQLNIDYDVIDETNCLEIGYLTSISSWRALSHIAHEGFIQTDAYKRWLKTQDAEKIASKIVYMFNMTFSCIIECKPGHADKQTISQLPTGIGWPLETAEMLMRIYDMSYDEAMEFPLGRTFAFIVQNNLANGCKLAGPCYYQREYNRQMKQMISQLKDKDF